MSERMAFGYKLNSRENKAATAGPRSRWVTATTIGLVGVASMVLTSCRAPEPPIPAGNGSGTGTASGGPDTPAGGAGGVATSGGTGGAATSTGGTDAGPVSGTSGTGGQAGGPASGGASGSALGGQSGAPAVTGGASGTASGGQAGGAAIPGGSSGGHSGAMATGGTTGVIGSAGGQGPATPGTGGMNSPSGSGGRPADSGGGSATGGSPGTGAPGVGGGSGGQTTAPAGSGGAAEAPAPGTGGSAGASGSPLASVTSDDSAGSAITLRLGGALTDPADDFNVALGTNGRGCATCHVAGQSMSLTPAGVQARFDATDGTDPLFRPVDGAVSPRADVSTSDARRTAYALLLSKGLIRVGLPIPANADFDLIAVSDPYAYASATELSLFRRPLPASNLSFLSAVMWDGREGMITRDDPTNALLRALASQAGDAVLGHSQAASPLDPSRVTGIVDFELGIFSAQATNLTAGPLSGAAALGGPLALAQQTFYPGINDSSGTDPTNPYNPNVFTMYAPWADTAPQGSDADARRQIALGEQLFDTRTFTVTGVAGLTTTDQPTMTVTCSTCHDAPGAGSNSSGRFFDLGVASAARAGTELPVYTLQERSTGTQVQVSDPGRALITGAFKDVGTFKVPTLRGLAARAPYFHNGIASTLSGVVGFYNGRFSIGLTSDEKAALAAFLSSL